MLNYGYWQRKFGGDPTVVGRNISMDSRPKEIVGVMPRGFRIVDTDFDVLVPVSEDRGKAILAGFGYNGIARLKPGVTIAQANADMTRMLPIWMDTFTNGPGSNPHIYESWKITPAIRPLKDEVIGNVSDTLWVVMGTIALVMLIACANVTNLFLVRGESRQQEMAVRAALGAGSVRIVRALLVESVMLGLMGGVVGIGIAYGGVKLLMAIGPANLPRLEEIAVDWRTLVFGLALSVLAGLLFGLIPALRYGRSRGAALSRAVAGRTTSASRERHRARNILVVGQVAMALVLLVCAGLMIRTFDAMRHVQPGFTDARTLQLMRIAIPDSLITGAGAGNAATASDSRQTGDDSGSEVGGVRKRHAVGRIRGGLGRTHGGREKLSEGRDSADAALQVCGAGILFDGGHAVDCRARLHLAGHLWTAGLG